jgi:hypothetical protein
LRQARRPRLNGGPLIFLFSEQLSTLARVGMEHPVVQAETGGGIAGAAAPADAASATGRLGTVGIMGPARS